MDAPLPMPKNTHSRISIGWVAVPNPPRACGGAPRRQRGGITEIAHYKGIHRAVKLLQDIAHTDRQGKQCRRDVELIFQQFYVLVTVAKNGGGQFDAV